MIKFLISGAIISIGSYFLFRKKGNLPTNFDGLFSRNCSGVPVEYLRALAKRESNFNPFEKEDPAWGLLQVVPTVLSSYNERFNTTYTKYDLLNPDINTKIACELISRISKFYNDKHPEAFPGGFFWYNRRHVELVTFGWNAGWSESRGVAGVIGHLVSIGESPENITIDAVYQAALKLDYISEHLKNYNKVIWCKSVVDLFIKEIL